MGENRNTKDPVKEIIKFIDNHQPEKNWNEFTRTWNKGYEHALSDVRHLLEDLEVANKKN